MGRRREGNHSPQKKKFYTGFSGKLRKWIPDLNKILVNVTEKPSYAHKKPSKRKSLKKSLRNSWRRY
jgi:hypothetical protein